jgi:hypothetical protein
MAASPPDVDPTAVVRFSADPQAPITVSFLGTPLEVILVAKQSVPHAARQLSKDVWAVAGVYVLLGPIRRADERTEDGPLEDDSADPADVCVSVCDVEVASAEPPDPARPTIRARPGSGDDVLHRLRDHPRESPWFTRAIVARDTRRGWTGSEAKFLEGRLHELCRLSPMVEHYFRIDGDRTLGDTVERIMERQYLTGIVAALRLAGAQIDAGAP